MTRIDRNGLTIESFNDIFNRKTSRLREIYGEDIDLGSNTPDGQRVNIESTAQREVLEVLREVYDSFDPDKATGRVLDQRVAINGIIRTGGSRTIQNIDVEVDRAVTLQGVDQVDSSLSFTVSDSSGNLFHLLETIEITEAGTSSLAFRSANFGDITLPIGSINIPNTIILGVVSVGNSESPSSVGNLEQSDSSLRLLRDRASLDQTSVISRLLNLEGVTEAVYFQNRGSTVDSNGTPANSLWVVVEGGETSDIARVIDSNIPLGIGLRGDSSGSYTDIFGQSVSVNFDRPDLTTLYLRFNIDRTVSSFVFNTNNISNYIAENFSATIGQEVNSAIFFELIKEAIDEFGGGGVPLDIEVSNNNSSFNSRLSVVDLNDKFVLSSDNITINIV